MNSNSASKGQVVPFTAMSSEWSFYPYETTSLLLKSFFSSLFLPSLTSASTKKGSPEKKGRWLMSTPTFHTTTTGIIVQVFYYVGSKEPSHPSAFLLTESGTKNIGEKEKVHVAATLPVAGVKSLCSAISRLFPTMAVELQLVQQHSPYLNASILAQYLAHNASKYGFHRIMTLLLNAVPYFNILSKDVANDPDLSLAFSSSSSSSSSSAAAAAASAAKAAEPAKKGTLLERPSMNGVIPLPECTTGLKVQLSGLLTTQRNRARKTVYTASAGTFHSSGLQKGNSKSIPTTIQCHYAESTFKSIEGAFNVKVWMSSTAKTEV